MLTFYIQQLGEMDIELSREDKFWVARDDGASLDSEGALSDALRLTRHTWFSFLWVLAAYEATRTLDEALRSANRADLSSARAEIQQLKKRLAEVRIPLAKLQPPGRQTLPGSVVPGTVVVRDVGLGWSVAASRLVSRQELSDVMVEALEDMRRRFGQNT